jgi:hypothetical protein
MASFEYLMGIFFSVLAGICFNLAPAMQKSALSKWKQDVSFSNMKYSIRTMFTDRKWVFGLMVGAFGVIPFIIAMSLVGISVVQPVMTIGMIVLVIYSEKRLGEKLNIWAKSSIGFMIAMPFFIGLADLSNAQSDITEPLTRNKIFIITGILLILILGFTILAKKYPIFYTGVIGLFYALSAYYMQAYMSMIASSGYNFIQDLDLIIKRAFTDPDIIIANLFFIALIIFSGLAGFTLQIGLQKLPASRCNPIQQTINNIVSILSGILIFKQEIGNIYFYSIGVAFGLFAIVMLGRYQISPTPPIETLKEEKSD